MRYEYSVQRSPKSRGVRGCNVAILAGSSAESVQVVRQATGSRLGFAGCSGAANLGVGHLRRRRPAADQLLSLPINHLGGNPGECASGGCGNHGLCGKLQFERFTEPFELPKLHSFAAASDLRAYRSGEVSAIPGYQLLAERHTLRSHHVHR